MCDEYMSEEQVPMCRFGMSHAIAVQKDGELKPGTKGIALNKDQWHILEANIGDLSRALKNEDVEFSLELGKNRRAAVSDYKGKLSLDIREFYEKDGNVLPGEPSFAAEFFHCHLQWSATYPLICTLICQIEYVSLFA